MSASLAFLRRWIVTCGVLALLACCSESFAQQGGFQIGGPNGVVIGGGEGLRIGGANGVQFGGGRGAKFGGPDGVQFGGGAGAKFGPLQFGGQAADDPDAKFDKSPRPTTVHYPQDAKRPLAMELNGKLYSLLPGEFLSLRSDRVWVIRFSPGRQYEDRRYSLPAGDYQFKQTKAGWDLSRLKRQQEIEELPTPAGEEKK